MINGMQLTKMEKKSQITTKLIIFATKLEQHACIYPLSRTHSASGMLHFRIWECHIGRCQSSIIDHRLGSLRTCRMAQQAPDMG